MQLTEQKMPTHTKHLVRRCMNFCSVTFDDQQQVLVIYFYNLPSSETMSVPTFHYIQVQLYQYYEMVMMEKKEAKIWAKRYVVNSGSVVENPGAFINHN